MDWDTISAIVTFVLGLVSPHWSFFAVAFILGILGEVAKNIVLGPENQKLKNSEAFKLYKKTLSVHPVIVGAILGFILSGTFDGMLYFALSGAISSAFYKLLKKLYPDIVKAIRSRFARLMGFNRKDKDRLSDDT